jgi:hypothetical protein
VFEVRERQDALRRVLLTRSRLRHRRRPPSASPTASRIVTLTALLRPDHFSSGPPGHLRARNTCTCFYGQVPPRPVQHAGSRAGANH